MAIRGGGGRVRLRASWRGRIHDDVGDLAKNSAGGPCSVFKAVLG